MTRSIIALGLVLASAGSSRAATLYTPLMGVGAGNSTLCSVVNTSSKPITVEVSSHLSGGTIFGIGSIEVQPGSSVSTVSAPTASHPPHLSYCRFEFKGGKSKVRASICHLDNTTSGCTAVAAAR